MVDRQRGWAGKNVARFGGEWMVVSDRVTRQANHVRTYDSVAVFATSSPALSTYVVLIFSSVSLYSCETPAVIDMPLPRSTFLILSNYHAFPR
jgi:hypothetical protein